MLGRELQTRLTLLQSDKLRKFEMQTNVNEGTRSFEPDNPVWLRNYSGNPKWIAGTVVMKTGPVSYKVMSGDHIYKRHVDQIKKRSVNVDETSSQSSDEFFSIPSP